MCCIYTPLKYIFLLCEREETLGRWLDKASLGFVSASSARLLHLDGFLLVREVTCDPPPPRLAAWLLTLAKVKQCCPPWKAFTAVLFFCSPFNVTGRTCSVRLQHKQMCLAAVRPEVASSSGVLKANCLCYLVSSQKKADQFWHPMATNKFEFLLSAEWWKNSNASRPQARIPA